MSALGIVPFALSGEYPWLFSGWYPRFSRAVSAALSMITGILPISLGEIGLTALCIGAIVHWIRAVRRGRQKGILKTELLRALSVTLLWIGALGASFVWLWGINYNMPTLSGKMGLTVETQSVERLIQTATILRDEANALASGVARGADLRMEPQSFWDTRQAVAEGYQALSANYDFITSWGGHAKRITFWFVQSYTGISGIYVPWTAECTVNPDTPWPNLPVTMAHEMAHRQGAAPEDEANYLGVLACREAEAVYVRYSGAYLAFVYASNALMQEDVDAMITLWEGLSPEVLADLSAVTSHYKQYEGTLTEVGDTVNDTYLRAMGQESGSKSYGLVVDLLIAEFLAKGKIE